MGKWALRAFLAKGKGALGADIAAEQGGGVRARKGRPRGGLALRLTAVGPAPAPCIQSCFMDTRSQSWELVTAGTAMPSTVRRPQSRRSAMPPAAKQQRCSNT